MVYGLVSLFTIIVALTFLNFVAWRDMKAEKDRLNALENARAAEFIAFRGHVDAAKAAAAAATATAEMVKGSHYDQLLKRIDSAEATANGCLRQCEIFAEKIASFGGRLSSMARKPKETPEGEADPAGPVLPLYQLPAQQTNGHQPSRFGQKAR